VWGPRGGVGGEVRGAEAHTTPEKFKHTAIEQTSDYKNLFMTLATFGFKSLQGIGSSVSYNTDILIEINVK